MKLLRYGIPGYERPGLLDQYGGVRDLSGHIEDLGLRELSPQSLEALAKLDPGTLPLAEPGCRLGVPVAQVGKIVGIGLNYREHAIEANIPIPQEPIVFLKATSSLCGPNDTILLPKGSRKTDWEVELGIVIGVTARSVNKRDALTYIAGYCVVNDVSEREYQMERGGTWDKGKGCDTFCQSALGW